METPYRVHIILDREYGQNLTKIPVSEPVWVVASSLNETVAREIWRQRPTGSHLEGITLFQSDAIDAEQTFLGVLNSIDLHHGEYSANPPYAVLEVVGCSSSEEIRSALGELGFSIGASTLESFSAKRTSSL